MKRHASRAMPLLAVLAAAATFILPNTAHAQRNRAVAPAAASEARVALVIGNSAYKESPLANPANDADDMARTLEGTGFKVILRKNAGTREMRQAIREFSAELRRAQGGAVLFRRPRHPGQGQELSGAGGRRTSRTKPTPKTSRSMPTTRFAPWRRRRPR